ncbi:hypothetical protein AB4Z54_59375, partial [Streptomyces sp. MCAF7]
MSDNEKRCRIQKGIPRRRRYRRPRHVIAALDNRVHCSLWNILRCAVQLRCSDGRFKEERVGTHTHGHGEGHAGHSHGVAENADRRWLLAALSLISGFIVIEGVIGVVARSLA